MTDPPKNRPLAPLLTIAIPTYNRAKYLRTLLSQLGPQIGSDPRVELLISDNASPDETPNVVDSFRAAGLPVRSLRNDVNVGSDANFLQCYEQATGKYVWIFGDDDRIESGGLAAVLSLLEKDDYDLVYIASLPQKSPAPDLPRSLRASTFEDPSAFVKRVHINFTFISGNIINKHRLEEHGAAPFASLVGTNLIQLGWVYEALNQFKKGLYVQSPLVSIETDNTGGYQISDVFGRRLKRIAEQRLTSPKLRRLILNGTIQRFWPGLVLTYRRSPAAFRPEPSLEGTLAQLFGNHPRYWIFVYPILVLPASLGNLWFLLTRVINRVDKALGYIL